MKQLLSVWLVPQAEDEKYLNNLIDKLGNENNSPTFTAHLTLFGDITIEFEQLKDAIDKVFENVKPFKIKKTFLSQSELFFKTVFIEFENSEILSGLSQNLAKETNENKNANDFKPHISLMYKLMPEDEKLKIIENLNLKDEYTIDRVFINAPGQETQDFYNVEGWQSLYIKQLV